MGRFGLSVIWARTMRHGGVTTVNVNAKGEGVAELVAFAVLSVASLVVAAVLYAHA